jgi:hypothetical protein
VSGAETFDWRETRVGQPTRGTPSQLIGKPLPVVLNQLTAFSASGPVSALLMFAGPS